MMVIPVGTDTIRSPQQTEGSMIVCDLDGVLGDFTTAACKVHGKEGYVSDKWNFFEDWGLTVDQFWEPIHALGDDFYEFYVKPYPWMAPLLSNIDSVDDFIIMSHPAGEHPSEYSGKRVWVDKYVNKWFDRKVTLIVGGDKHLLAGPDRLLLDDNDKNVADFVKAKGYALLFPQRWNKHKADPSGLLMGVYKGLNAWKAISKEDKYEFYNQRQWRAG